MTSNFVQYKIVERYMDGVRVVGYGIVDSRGSKRTISKKDAGMLALKGLIVNCKAQRYKGYDGGIVMKGVGCKLTDLPEIDVNSGKLRGKPEGDGGGRKKVGKSKIIARVADGRNVLGYVLALPGGSEIFVERGRVMELAENKEISNARIQYSNNNAILRGVGCDLSKLKTFQDK